MISVQIVNCTVFLLEMTTLKTETLKYSNSSTNLLIPTLFYIKLDQNPQLRYFGRFYKNMINFLTLISIVISNHVATAFGFYNYSYRKNSL